MSTLTREIHFHGSHPKELRDALLEEFKGRLAELQFTVGTQAPKDKLREFGRAQELEFIIKYLQDMVFEDH